jgi:hypothetical protein
MTTETTNTHTEAERIANEVFSAPPSPELIDELAKRFLEAKLKVTVASATAAAIEKEAVSLVNEWGTVPAHAEKSKRLAGRRAVLMVTKSDTITLIPERVEMVRDALAANDYPNYFGKLFAKVEKYEVVEGAESALKTESLPKRLAEKILNLYGRCFDIKPKKPSLKVELADPATPAKKAKKGAK